MQFKNIQINGFGKLEEIHLDFKNGLNLIVGENESGKSTLTEFIKGIFYGVNRNKAGKEYSDYEKLKPWKDSNFSGKLTYELEDEEYIVYRDFNRNNAKVYDKSGIDITGEFNKDKARGAEVGATHFGMDEDTFENSVFVRQKEIKVNELSQNTMLQKLTNMIQSGEEDVSYEATIKKLEKILLEEVGTERTQNKPKNVLKREIAELELAKSQLLSNRTKQDEIDRRLKVLREKEKKNEKELADAIQVFDIKNKYEQIIQEEKAKFDLEKKVKAAQKEKIEKKNHRKKWIDTLLISLGLLVLTISFLWMKEYVLAGFSCLAGILAIFLNLKFSYKEEVLPTSDNFDVVSEEARKKEKKELEMLESNGVKKSLTERKLTEMKCIIETAENEKNQMILEEHKLKIEEDSLRENLNHLNEIEEELALRKDKMAEVEEKEATLQLAITKLKEAYTELKEDVIPDIEKDIKYTISKTTNGQYKNVKYNDYDGLITENELGQLVTVDKLSAGTIDQMYLGFRLAIADKYHQVPIIFDEAFVFCDDVRLTNILKTLSEMAEDRQIIIMSCSTREERILEKWNIPFHEIRI